MPPTVAAPSAARQPVAIYRVPSRRRRWARIAVREGLYYGLLSAFSVVMLLPFLWMLSTSLKLDAEILSVPIRWLPRRVTFEHYRDAFNTVPFGRYFLNSLILATAGVVTNCTLGSLGGYAYARMRFRGNVLLFRLLLAGMMVPGVVTLIPTFIILRSFPLLGGNDWLGRGGVGLLNTYLAVILPGAAGAFAVFMMRQFFLTLPSELGEAARLDGASEFRIYRQIYLPLCKPALATLAIFTFQAGWNAFLFPLIVLNDPDLSTVQMGLAAFQFNYDTDYGPLMAASVVTVLPTIALYLWAQRYFAEGLAFTGSK
ncbi:MAG: carbohydrate ABC transporter permease [Thermomicrobiales bacterium]